MTRDRAALQEWYRTAMLRRIDELRDLRAPLAAGAPEAYDAARKVGQALRGSGATFGYADLSAVAAIVETSSDADVLRRVEGLITELHALTTTGQGSPFHAEWLPPAAGLDALAVATNAVDNLPDMWDATARAAGLSAEALAARVADRLGLAVADLAGRGRSALRLVPEALMLFGRIVPLSEDSETITVATADPTSLPMEIELTRLTGRRAVFSVAAPEAIEVLLSAILDAPSEQAPTDEVDATDVDSAPTLSEAEESAPPLRLPGSDHTRDKAVLVVDDDTSARLLVRTLLEKRGYRVLEAEDGLKALEVMSSDEPIGLVVADLNMPRMDGLELIWELRDARGWEQVPVIVVTGEIDEILETQLMEEGADDYIRKPVDPRLFLARVEATIRRAQA
ncbi:MAG: response regulator [Gemmatimonadetes bacterium]|nr:response regulator [Gemmatimonadota bacterium]MDA1103213.1 response regulator [Gemmatimonadota bacterium]